MSSGWQIFGNWWTHSKAFKYEFLCLTYSYKTYVAPKFCQEYILRDSPHSRNSEMTSPHRSNHLRRSQYNRLACCFVIFTTTATAESSWRQPVSQIMFNPDTNSYTHSCFVCLREAMCACEKRRFVCCVSSWLILFLPDTHPGGIIKHHNYCLFHYVVFPL